MPHSPAAESAVIGGILRIGKIPADLEAHLLPDDFYVPHLAAVYEACLALSVAGEPIDYVTVHNRLEPGTRRVLGDALGLFELAERTPFGGSVEHHAALVAADSERRRYITAGRQIVLAATGGDDDLAEVARTAIDSVPRLQSQSEPVWDVLARVIDGADNRPKGMFHGFPDLDAKVNPMRPGRMTTIGARSGVGKSTLAVDFLRAVAYRQGEPALLVSLEMDPEAVWSRVLAAESTVPLEVFERPGIGVTDKQSARIAQAHNRIGTGPLTVEYMPGAGVGDIRTAVRRHKPKVVAIDYLQLVRKPKADRNDLALAEVSAGLLNIAKTENCHIIVLSQLNRGSDSRTDKRPTVSDLRDTSALEHDSDVVMLLFRPDLVDAESERPGEMDVIIAKQRSGAAGMSVPLLAQLHYSRFASLAHDAPGHEHTDITQPARHY